MIKIEISDRVDTHTDILTESYDYISKNYPGKMTIELVEGAHPLTDTLEEEYHRCIRVGGYCAFPRWLLYEFIVCNDGCFRAINSTRLSKYNNIEEYTQTVKKVVNDRLEEEGAIFTALFKYVTTKNIHVEDRLRFKLDYSEYTGTEDTDLLDI